MNIFVSHFRKSFGCFGSTRAASAVSKNFGILIGYLLRDLLGNFCFWNMGCSGNVPFLPFLIIADIDDNRFRIGLAADEEILDGYLFGHNLLILVAAGFSLRKCLIVQLPSQAKACAYRC